MFVASWIQSNGPNGPAGPPNRGTSGKSSQRVKAVGTHSATRTIDRSTSRLESTESTQRFCPREVRKFFSGPPPPLATQNFLASDPAPTSTGPVLNSQTPQCYFFEMCRRFSYGNYTWKNTFGKRGGRVLVVSNRIPLPRLFFLFQLFFAAVFVYFNRF